MENARRGERLAGTAHGASRLQKTRDRAVNPGFSQRRVTVNFQKSRRFWVILSVTVVALLIVQQFWHWEVERVEVSAGNEVGSVVGAGAARNSVPARRAVVTITENPHESTGWRS